jgi:hypothetical protein
MPSEESPLSKYDRLKRQLQDTILKEYPNPQRKGCPGDEVVKRLAMRPLDEPLEADPNWHHLTHCSECYREFLAARAAMQQRMKVRRVRAGWGLAAAAVLIAVFAFFAVRQAGFHPGRPQNAELAYREKTVNIPSMTRGEGNGDPKPIFLERDSEELTFQLPLGSKAGTYELKLRQGDRTVFSTTAEAAIRDGTTTFTVRIDLSKFDSGNYSLDVRQPPWDWSYFPVAIR